MLKDEDDPRDSPKSAVESASSLRLYSSHMIFVRTAICDAAVDPAPSATMQMTERQLRTDQIEDGDVHQGESKVSTNHHGAGLLSQGLRFR